MLRADAADVLYHFMRAGGSCMPSICGRVNDDEHCSKFRSSAALNGTNCAGEQM